MKKISSYSDLLISEDGQVKFRFKYVHGKVEQFRMMHASMVRMLIEFNMKSDSFALPTTPVMKGWTVLRSNISRHVVLRLHLSDDRTQQIALSKDSAQRMAADLAATAAMLDWK
jgi:hypothetical protein